MADFYCDQEGMWGQILQPTAIKKKLFLVVMQKNQTSSYQLIPKTKPPLEIQFNSQPTVNTL